MITFEYPLTEKSRSYLRFESLFLQINQSILFNNESDTVSYFKALFELIELSDRSDIRLDLIKDLRKLSEQMQSWLSYEQADKKAVEEIISEISELMSALLVMSKQLKFFKDSRFLTSLKQRFFIPGGSCSFDLPQFHFWQSQDITVRQEDAKQWFEHFKILERALTLFLKIKRHQGVKSEQQAKNGFFQSEVEQALFIIVNVDPALKIYPMISGHKQRYSIRFMNINAENSHADCTYFEQVLC
ncbi:cell division protein ZapD [Psychromonas sp. RZ22]|uniref:cell division protein ZapD n=1 Tax=Psychromonas algarum TaxID=2555643 RepID=UPI001067ADCD|nr:cell division protein ZapD [Psychromonas sp. RZ22]TEW54908.1 cell division protein ZapD [Psychromonas sp. RZ22]